MIGSILDLAGEMTIHTELCWTQLMPLMYSSFIFLSGTKSGVILSGDFQTGNFPFYTHHSSLPLSACCQMQDTKEHVLPG